MWTLLAPTTSQRQPLLREGGGKEARGETCDCNEQKRAYEAGRSGASWLGGHEARCPSRGRNVDAVGARGRPFGLIRGDLHGSSRCPSAPVGVFVGWCGTVGLSRARFAVEKSAEAVLPAGIGWWLGRAEREVEREDVRARDRGDDRSQPREGSGPKGPRVKPEDPGQSAAMLRRLMTPPLTPPTRAVAGAVLIPRESRRGAQAPSRTPVPRASMRRAPRSCGRGCMTVGRRSARSLTRALPGRTLSGW